MTMINIYIYIYPNVFWTKNTKPDVTHIDLLHIVDEYDNGHFVYIKDFEKLMGTNGNHKAYYCKHCFQSLHHMKGYVTIIKWVAMM